MKATNTCIQDMVADLNTIKVHSSRRYSQSSSTCAECNMIESNARLAFSLKTIHTHQQSPAHMQRLLHEEDCAQTNKISLGNAMRSRWAAWNTLVLHREICVNTPFVLLSRAARPSKSTPNLPAMPEDATKTASFPWPIDDDLERSICAPKVE